MSSLRLRLAAVALLLLFALPVAPALALTAPSPPSAPAAAPLPAAPVAGGRFTPDYMILGQLEGGAVVQSSRPQSASLIGGVQFSSTYYTPNDLQNAYGVTTLLGNGDNGQGKTIAIIDAYGDPTINQDLAAFDQRFGLPAAHLTITPVGAYKPENGITYGWDAETALDVEAAHAMAPYANLDLVVATNSSNALFAAVKTVVDQHLGDVVTMSWGLGENSFGESGFSAAGYLNYAYLDYYFQKGAAEGITFIASSGDNGAFGGSTTVTAGFPASSPFVTGVGGTTLFMSTNSTLYSSAQYQGEAAWSVSPQYVGAQGVSSGGAYSSIFARPAYQSGVVSSPTRATPDVSAVANPYTGFEIVLEGGSYVIGGTSLSSPLWAGMTADMSQYVGKNLGALNPYLYKVASTPSAYDASFHQVTFGFNGAYSASPGYNLVTGLGTPNLPQLAQYVKALASSGTLSLGAGSPALAVSVSTSPGASSSAPSQYTYGESFTVSATVTAPSGSQVDTGTVNAVIQGPQGVVASIPLSFAGSSWAGSYTVASSDPAGSLTVSVTASSGGETGTGFADVNVGESIAILSPVPYPYGAPTPPGTPFQVAVAASTPSGAPLDGLSLVASLLYRGTQVTSAPLTDSGGGFYKANLAVTAGEPQGSYTLVVSEQGVGSVFGYLYIGEGVTGVIVGANDEPIPSASPGQLITLLAQPKAAGGDGVFTSQVTAYLYSLSGTQVAAVPLVPAPNSVQFGAFNFFQYQQANFTVPSGLAPGFYKVQFISSYTPSVGATTQMGNFTTGFYISAPTLSYTVSHAASVFEGQTLTMTAKITDSSGKPVTSGVFFATAVPTGYAYEAYLADIFGYAGSPMQYVPAQGEWVGSYQIPSTLTSPNGFTGNTASVNAGSWTAFVSGESSTAANVVPSASYVEVLPYTFIGSRSIGPGSASSTPLVTANGSSFALSGAAATSLSVSGVDLTLSGDSIASLTVTGANVTLVGTSVGNLTASGSTLSLTAGSHVGNLSLSLTSLTVKGSYYGALSPALPTVQVSGLSAPVGAPTQFVVTVTGSQIVNSTLNVSVDGSLVPATVAAVPGGYTLTATVDPSTLPDGTHTLRVNATQTDGMTATSSSYFTTDAQVASLSGKVSALSGEVAASVNMGYILAAIALVAIVLAAVALLRRPRPPVPAGQV